MPKKTDHVADNLDTLFNRLDEAKLSPETMLKTEGHKEHYESTAMFAFRKLQAARYHRQRVEEFIAAQGKELSEMAAYPLTKDSALKITSHTSRVTKSSNEFAFELCAFFAALRSAMDFIVMLCAEHIKEARQATSISTLLKLINKGTTGPLLDVISEDSEWILWMRSYRDHLVHQLVLQTTSGHQVQWEEGATAANLYPIVVPANMPKHVPDTRRARMFNEPESCFAVATSKAYITEANGTKRLIKHSVQIEPVEGYIRIEELVKREIVAFERFFVRIIDALIKLDFQPMPLKKHLGKPV